MMMSSWSFARSLALVCPGSCLASSLPGQKGKPREGHPFRRSKVFFWLWRLFFIKFLSEFWILGAINLFCKLFWAFSLIMAIRSEGHQLYFQLLASFLSISGSEKQFLAIEWCGLPSSGQILWIGDTLWRGSHPVPEQVGNSERGEGGEVLFARLR